MDSNVIDVDLLETDGAGDLEEHVLGRGVGANLDGRAGGDGNGGQGDGALADRVGFAEALEASGAEALLGGSDLGEGGAGGAKEVTAAAAVVAAVEE